MRKYRVLTTTLIACTALIIGPAVITPPQTNTCNCYSTSSLYNVVIKFNNQVPGDLPSFQNQSQADCFAWQEFISLNWPTNSGNFGNPGDFSPVAWETYMPKNVLFQPGGVPPPKWGTLVSPAFAAKFKTQQLLLNPTKTKLLTFTSKFADTDTSANLDPDEAGVSGPAWLGSQNGRNVWYEVMLNQDYYNFIVQKGYYNAITQHDSVKNGSAINFPMGAYNGAVGAIELKVAWMEVPDTSSKQWTRYKLSKAVVYDSTLGKLRPTTVALIGFHILHKTTNQPTWVWATFEHVDNVPDVAGETPPPYGYNLYNPKCTTRQVSLKGGGTATIVCTPNTQPTYYLSQAAPVPIQITRVNSLDTKNSVPINDSMQANIRKFYPNSVFQYYQLVDVIWNQGTQPPNTKPQNAPFPLNTAAMQAGVATVANTAAESYVQGTNTCFNCHVYSTIAPYAGDAANNKIFGDFSFAIGAAQYSSTSPKSNKKARQ